jgi:hypothetical protein
VEAKPVSANRELLFPVAPQLIERAAPASSVGQKNMFNVRVLRPHPCAKQSTI